jgi:peptide/nickel transport system ATP-binding protein
MIGLQKPTRGEVRFDGQVLASRGKKRLRKIRQKMQMIFQDAGASLNPARGVGKSIAEPLRVRGGVPAPMRAALARELMMEVGLNPDRDFHKRPFEFSGGQCQRISIARALIAKPHLLICDEPVSSLDVSVQAQILNLLEDIKTRHGLTLFFISHDLAVVKNICDRVAVMYLGKLCEVADSRSLFGAPRHPYTAALLAAIPKPSMNRGHSPDRIESLELPSPVTPPSGCRFHTRCPKVRERCIEREPELTVTPAGRQLACHFPLN